MKRKRSAVFVDSDEATMAKQRNDGESPEDGKEKRRREEAGATANQDGRERVATGSKVVYLTLIIFLENIFECTHLQTPSSLASSLAQLVDFFKARPSNFGLLLTVALEKLHPKAVSLPW
ncbi:hypothetical protein L2E82_14915 [Cichorium intybus]|uniref:Uncharacterized protein n=1 Tax=Cichorium intybus TaxID=13427 RepID=A0ACB9F287_CICIN|nr:hypothetical protein L2E82_14915 [Cichorium intybus]